MKYEKNVTIQSCLIQQGLQILYICIFVHIFNVSILKTLEIQEFLLLIKLCDLSFESKIEPERPSILLSKL